MHPYKLGVFREGDCIPPMAIQRDGLMVNFVGGLLQISTLVYSPSEHLKHMANVHENGIQLGISTYQDVLQLTVKLGSLPWQDAPYSPHLQDEADLPRNIPVPSGGGLAASHLLVDSADGRILQVVPFVLSNYFSNCLISAVHQLKHMPFDSAEYFRKVADIQSRYSPRELNKLPGTERFHYSPQHK